MLFGNKISNNTFSAEMMRQMKSWNWKSHIWKNWNRNNL